MLHSGLIYQASFENVKTSTKRFFLSHINAHSFYKWHASHFLNTFPEKYCQKTFIMTGGGLVASCHFQYFYATISHMADTESLGMCG